ncbi:MAG: hypothetical protein Q8N53_21865 [Longimicrobiales bacterium]|nr:hypothetical protein [Longimicrobiales bacterium]
MARSVCAWRAALALVLAAVLCGCATGGGSPTPRGSSDRLTAADMESWGAEDLLTVIQRMRPHWLQARKATNFSGSLPTSVVVDGLIQSGSLEVLRGYLAGHVQEVSFVNASDATTLYGLSMMSGAIVVALKR